MSIDISAIAHAITRTSTAQQRIRIGHAQQCIAAALGHSSLASLQASGEANIGLGLDTHIVLDTPALLVRAHELGISPAGRELAEIVRDAFNKELVGIAIHMSLDDFRDALQKIVDDEVVNDGTVSGETAVTNSNGIREIYMPIEGFDLADVPKNGDLHEIDVRGHISMEQDKDRPYVGHRVDVRANLALSRPCRAVWLVDCRVEEAALDNSWYEPADTKPVVRTLAEALADVFEVDLEAAEELADAPLMEVWNAVEFTYGYEFDFSEARVDDEVLDHIREQHGSLQVRVGEGFFEYIKEFMRPRKRYYLHGDAIETQDGKYHCTSCDDTVDADHFEAKHPGKAANTYFSDMRKWRRWAARKKGGVTRPPNAANVLAAAAHAQRAAYEASRSAFHRWLEEQRDRDDRVGDLAGGVMRDKRFPVSSSSREALRQYVEAAAPDPEVLSAFDQAWAEFEGAV